MLRLPIKLSTVIETRLGYVLHRLTVLTCEKIRPCTRLSEQQLTQYLCVRGYGSNDFHQYYRLNVKPKSVRLLMFDPEDIQKNPDYITVASDEFVAEWHELQDRVAETMDTLVNTFRPLLEAGSIDQSTAEEIVKNHERELEDFIRKWQTISLHTLRKPSLTEAAAAFKITLDSLIMIGKLDDAGKVQLETQLDQVCADFEAWEYTVLDDPDYMDQMFKDANNELERLVKNPPAPVGKQSEQVNIGEQIVKRLRPSLSRIETMIQEMTQRYQDETEVVRELETLRVRASEEVTQFGSMVFTSDQVDRARDMMVKAQQRLGELQQRALEKNQQLAARKCRVIPVEKGKLEGTYNLQREKVETARLNTTDASSTSKLEKLVLDIDAAWQQYCDGMITLGNARDLFVAAEVKADDVAKALGKRKNERNILAGMIHDMQTVVKPVLEALDADAENDQAIMTLLEGLVNEARDALAKFRAGELDFGMSKETVQNGIEDAEAIAAALSIELIRGIDFYEILDVTVAVGEAELKTRYRVLSMMLHPDRYQDTAQKVQAERLFKTTKEAFETLSDPARRDAYNRRMGIG